MSRHRRGRVARHHGGPAPRHNNPYAPDSAADWSGPDWSALDWSAQSTPNPYASQSPVLDLYPKDGYGQHASPRVHHPRDSHEPNTTLLGVHQQDLQQKDRYDRFEQYFSHDIGDDLDQDRGDDRGGVRDHRRSSAAVRARDVTFVVLGSALIAGAGVLGVASLGHREPPAAFAEARPDTPVVDEPSVMAPTGGATADPMTPTAPAAQVSTTNSTPTAAPAAAVVREPTGGTGAPTPTRTPTRPASSPSRSTPAPSPSPSPTPSPSRSPSPSPTPSPAPSQTPPNSQIPTTGISPTP